MSPRRRKHRTRRRDAWLQATVVVTVVSGLVGLGLVATDQFAAGQRHQAEAQAHAAFPTAPASIGDETFTGSILYAPDDGHLCHQMFFDNRSGTFTDNGYVDCARAAYRGDNPPKQWSTDRMVVISNGFAPH